MMELQCLKLIVYGLACVLETPATPEPQAFVYGRTVDRLGMVEAQTFNPPLPDMAFIVPAKPPVPARQARAVTQPRQQRRQQPQVTPDNVQPAAYAATSQARGLGAIVDRLTTRRSQENPGALYVRASGNEQMECVHDNKFLMMMLRRIRDNWGKPVIVNSAYRSPSHNARVRGAKRSYHMSCRALDVRVEGVPKDTMAKWLRAQPEVGGVGIYCSAYVHFDNGSKRNWDWRRRCR